MISYDSIEPAFLDYLMNEYPAYDIDDIEQLALDNYILAEFLETLGLTEADIDFDN